ncbi:MAG: exodeoxyribonuclease III [Chitinophagaceae bacterium]
MAKNNMRIVSYNVNGIRAALKKGLLDWLKTDPADIVCFQELKALETDIDLSHFTELGYHVYWYAAEKKGYSGVAILTKVKPEYVQKGNGTLQSDAEGRVIRADFEHFTLINAYFPSGTSGDIRQTYKYQWLDEFQSYIDTLKKEHPNIVITGDYNIAHTEIDIHDPKGNKNSSGFLPDERAWMDRFLASGFVDTFRYLHPDERGRYSWWSQRFPTVRLNNKGWRIDYISVTTPLAKDIVRSDIYPDVKQSDHCPIYLELKA